ncbi:MAG TPA: NUDIX domain-containing protein [Nitrococcus sp.]|nr:NUDIX domain-containing protein [Nitrococcus sp.]
MFDARSAQRRYFGGPAAFAITTDVAIFTVKGSELAVLLVRRDHPPFRGQWALPGGLLGGHEAPDDGARRVLAEKTGLEGVYLEQLYTFGQPDRDPRGQVVSIGYFALVPCSCTEPWRSELGEIAWQATRNLPELAFDHADIITMARQRLAAKLGYSTIALQLMPRRFTLGQLQAVYETILGESLDKRNFRKRFQSLGCIEATDEMYRPGGQRPARLYRRCQSDRVQFIK